MSAGQTLEIPFRDSGWVYLGETKSQRGIEYLSRRPDREGQSFIFRADRPGTYGLKFYKQDFVRDYILNDTVEVIVSAPSSETSIAPAAPEAARIVALPRWPLAPEDPGQRTEEAPASRDQTPSEAAPAAPQPAEIPPEAPPSETPALEFESIEDYIAAAREDYEAGRHEQGLETMRRLTEHFPLGNDEAWFLYGQILEASSPVRDIRSALDYYRRLIREFPQSERYAEARRRIAYLERFYFNIQ